MLDDILTEKIIGCAYKVYNVLGHGFLEKVYENALKIELEKQGLMVEQQISITVYYDEHVVGDYTADLLVEGRILIELKAVQNLNREHEVQLVNYLTATRLNIGLLINFGVSSVQIKRRWRELKK
jgi:GxxExxY protein